MIMQVIVIQSFILLPKVQFFKKPVMSDKKNYKYIYSCTKIVNSMNRAVV